MQTDFSRAQQAVEIVLSEYDDLREQGFTRSAALEHVRLNHGVARHKLVALLNDRDFRGAPAHGGYPGEVTTEAPDVPDTFPEEWT